MSQLHETMMEILELFMGIGEPNYWVSYLVPENATAYRQLVAMSASGFDELSVLMDVGKLEQLMSETRIVLLRYVYSNLCFLGGWISLPVLHQEFDDLYKFTC